MLLVLSCVCIYVYTHTHTHTHAHTQSEAMLTDSREFSVYNLSDFISFRWTEPVLAITRNDFF